MSIIANRFANTPWLPMDYASVAMTRAQCATMLESFRPDGFIEQWELVEEYNAQDVSADEIRSWLLKSQIQGLASFLWIPFRDGVTIDFALFVRFYDDLWFPSSDDLLIVSSKDHVALLISHEEVMSRYKAAA